MIYFYLKYYNAPVTDVSMPVKRIKFYIFSVVLVHLFTEKISELEFTTKSTLPIYSCNDLQPV